MRHGPELLGPGRVEDLRELLRRIPHLRGVQPHPRDPGPVGERSLQGRRRVLGREMPQEAHDEGRGDAQPLAGVGHGPVEPLHEGGEGDPPLGVRLRIEEDLCAPHVLTVHAEQVRPHEVVEVLLGPEHVGSLVVDVQERLQVGELVGGPDVPHVREVEGHAVPLRQLEHHLRLERALDVEVQLGLGHGPDECLQSRPLSKVAV